MKISGVMIESHLLEGAQKLPNSSTLKEGEPVLEKLKYGVSVTDGCIGWTTTAEVLKQLAAGVQARRAARSKK
jgi:3-deoxy-7-phosphoheptulonate synthase